ncbi:MAG: chondroitinase-B domain-containing protein [Planctomycetota bacterium]|nr:chondroitinase-B domain-containing protein [Planctomycetota bacterium]
MSLRVSKQTLFLVTTVFFMACGSSGSSSTPGGNPTATNIPGPTPTPTPTPTPAPTPTPSPGADPAWYTTPTVVGIGVQSLVLNPNSGPTLSQAFSTAQAGDEIVLNAGTYTHVGGNLSLSQSGTASNWIAVRGSPGTRPTIDLDGQGEFKLGGSFILLENVEIINGRGNNLHIAPSGTSVSNVIVRNCVIRSLNSGPGAAIKMNRDNNNNTGVDRIYLENNDLSESIGNAIIDGVGVTHGVARGNDVHDNAVGSHGVFYKGGSHDILIEKNLIRGIRQNAALQLGGNTGSSFFHPNLLDREGADQVARNNFIVDCDDSVFEIRGVNRGKIYHNTVITQSAFAVFRLSFGNSSTSAQSGNDNIECFNNIILCTGGNPQYARNDANSLTINFGPQLWGGNVRNSGSAGGSIPTFPGAMDVIVGANNFSSVLLDPQFSGLTGMTQALSRFRLSSGSPAFAAATPNTVVPADIIGTLRSAAAPSMGAYENP